MTKQETGKDMQKTPVLIMTVAAAMAISACSKHAPTEQSAPGANADNAPGAGAQQAGGTIAIDGSSTVFPITEAVAEEFQKTSEANVLIGVSGTGGGFKKFCKGETIISGASRPIKPTEVEMCGEAGIKYTELPVAYDGIAIVVHRDAKWVDTMTVEELKKLWAPEAQGKVMKWSQVRTGWPDEEIHLFGPGVDSGTYDYFTKAIVGTEHASRGDFTSSEDDNVLVQGVSTDPGGLGFFGFAYYASNRDKLKLIAIDDGNEDNGKGAIAPSVKSVANGTYQPLARPIFIYVAQSVAKRADVDAFITYYLTKSIPLVTETGYIPLPPGAYELALKRFKDNIAGSLFTGGSKVGVTVEQLLAGG